MKLSNVFGFVGWSSGRFVSSSIEVKLFYIQKPIFFGINHIFCLNDHKLKLTSTFLFSSTREALSIGSVVLI